MSKGLNQRGIFNFFCILTLFSGAYAQASSTIINAANGKCIADPGYSSALYTQLIQWDCDNGSDDNFQLTQNGDGSYTLKNLASNLCVDDLGYSTSSGAAIGQYTCDGDVNQKFNLVSVTSGQYELKNAYSGLCLAIPNGSSSNGTGLVQESCGSSGEAFKISGISAPAPSPSPSPTSSSLASGVSTMISSASGLCVADGGYSTALYNPFIQWACDGGSDNSFQFTKNSDGSFSIQSLASGLCMDDLGYSSSAGSNIGQYTCDGESNQKFIATSLSSGVYSFKNAYSGLCLAIANGSSSNGANVVQEPCGGSAQSFKVSTSGGSASSSSSSSSGSLIPSTAQYFAADQNSSWKHTEDQSSSSGACSDTTTEENPNSCSNGSAPNGMLSNTSAGYTVPAGAPNSTGRLFQLSYYNGYADERFWANLGTTSTATHFAYDAWVYLNRTDLIYDFEMDINHTNSNGNVFIMASQCNFVTGNWEYGNSWIAKPGNMPCAKYLTPGAWHHVTILFHHGSSNVYYDSVTVDGVTQQFSSSVSNPIDTNDVWGQNEVIPNFQLDANAGASRSGVVNAYTSQFRIYYW